MKKSVALHGLADERLESRIAKRVAALSLQHEVELGGSQDDCRSLALRASGDPSAGDEAAKLSRYPNGVTFPGTIRTVGKGSKPLVTPMHPALKELLFGYTLEHTDIKGQSPLLRQLRKKQSRSVGRPVHAPHARTNSVV